MTFWDLLSSAQRRNSDPINQVQYGLVIGPADSGLYPTNIGNLTYEAESYVTQRLLPGDRVLVIMGNGNPKIISLHARDVNISSP